MATHSGVLAWRIPGTAEPGGLPSLGSHRVGHDWSDLAAVAAAPAPGTLLLCPLIPMYCLHLLTQLTLSNLQTFLKRLLSKAVPGPQGHPFPWLCIQGYQKFLPMALFTVSIIYSSLWRDQFHKTGTMSALALFYWRSLLENQLIFIKWMSGRKKTT